ncbi:MAG: hypothetical protein A2020_12840 [Lentisphaerae bacterium GWF2_45_14]|nr:MAG: hypothetical protein A2020_12840 [Lentisphaerae bacterium GWF2_45_14]
MTRNDAISTRIKIMCLIFFVVLAWLAFHLYEVQITRHDELYGKARDTYTSVKTKQGKRGEIYDYDGNLLVGNIPCFDLCADPEIIGDEENCRIAAGIIAKELPELKKDDLVKRLMKKTRNSEINGKPVGIKNNYAFIASNVELKTAKDIEDALKKKKIKGISFKETTKRYYPKNELLANILGFTNIDRDEVIAVIGLEKFFNEFIKPSSSEIHYERARDGLPLSYGWQNKIDDAKDGMNVYLTIREPIQAILEEELDKLMDKWKPRAAYAIMADPFTGSIIAVAQRPTFNPNDRKSMLDPDAWRNRITEDIFEPGSIMKPMAVAGAIDSGIVTPNTSFDCENGAWFYGGKMLRDSHPLSLLTVSQIIQKSSNIGTAKIALKMGERHLYYTLKSFGFGDKTGVPLKPETSGIFRPLKKWDTLSITRFPIGQGIGVSPLQLVRAYCALANGGYLVKLRMIDKLENPDTGHIIKIPVKPGMKIFKNSKTHQQIVSMMKLVTQKGGTATKAAIDGYQVAGKTGTSQKVINGQYSHSKFFASFAGFVPADNPAFVLFVTVDEPQGAEYGGTISAPAFREISERTLRYLDIKPDVLSTVVSK